MTRRARLLETWRFRLKGLRMEQTAEREALLHELAETFIDPRTEEENEAVSEARDAVEDSLEAWQRQLHEQCPPAFFIPSLEQALVLNAWHPEARTEGFRDVDEARLTEFIGYEGGYRSVGNFGANRVGKTSIAVFDTLLWIIPNDPSWEMFQWRPDWLGRGWYRIIPRFDWEAWHRRGRRRVDPDQPPKGACDIWWGVGRDDDWHNKVFLELRKWLPTQYLGTRTDGGQAIYKAEKRIDTQWGHRIVGRSMSAEADAWSGKAAWRINIDEGMTRAIFRECMTRVQDGGYFSQAYTPAEPANIGEKAQVAKSVFRQEPGYELVGKSRFFTRFRVEDAPPWIIPEQKKKDDLKRYAGMGDEGKARAEGGFWDGSPRVFPNFKREVHVLPWGEETVLEAIAGRGDPRLVEIFEDANILRGFDEGIAHPSACGWPLLLRTGEYVIMRTWEQSGLSVSQRVGKVVELSGNQLIELKDAREEEAEAAPFMRELVQQHLADQKRQEKTGTKPIRHAEVFVREPVRKTFADHKMFRRDPLHPLDDWTEHYVRAGLKIVRSKNIGPAARCDYLNELLLPDGTRRHLDPDRRSEPGARLYVLASCRKMIERFENYLFAQHKDGTFTGEPEDEDDDTVDAVSFPIIERLRWVHPSQYRAQEWLAGRIPRETALLSAQR